MFVIFDVINPIPTGHGRNQPIYECHVTTAGRNRVKAAKINESVVVYITGMTLFLADKDQMNRQELFSQLTKNIYGGIWYTIPVSNFILSAQRLFSNLDVQKVMPFIEFCLRSSIRSSTSHELNVFKVQLSTFKNSLKIMKQFGDSKKTMTFQPVETELKFELVRGQEL